MIDQKKNDWLATLFFQPDKSVQDIVNLGITPDNSSLQDREYYKNIPEIQEAFKNDRGEFDNQKFDSFYQSSLDLYNKVDKEKLSSTAMNTFTYDPMDYFAPLGGDVREVSPRLVRFANPERRNRGIVNLYETSGPSMSIREVAQTNKVFNTDTGKFESWTPNDWGGLSAITRPTLVLAQWDADGEHIVGNRTVTHKKGDLKFNDYGDPYYETLGNRDLTGKDILHIADTLTIDGSAWNKYDFFDSDGLDKSVSGTVAKTVLKVAPMLIPYVGPVYGALTAGIELGKLFPVLFKSIEGIATGDLSTSKSAQTATDLQAWFSRFDGSLSDYARNKFWSLESLGKLVEDSSKQLFQQRVIGQIPKWIVGKDNISENAVRWGRAMSLAYMAGTSSTEAYESFKQAGASDRTAGLGMLSVMGAMFGLMNNDYFKDFWFKDTYLDKAQIRNVVKEAADKVVTENINKGVISPKTAANWVIKTKNNIQARLASIKPGTLLHDSLNEGIEETMEEVSSDIVKSFYSGLNALGITDPTKKYDFGMSAEDILSRYTTAFAGGTIGGAVFHLHNKWDSRMNAINNDAIQQPDDSLQEIIYLLRNNKKEDIKKELDKLYNNGKLGSTNLSGKVFEIVKEPEGLKLQYHQAVEGESQNDVVYNQLNSYIDRIDAILSEEGLDLSDDQLQELTKHLGVNITPEIAQTINRSARAEELISSGVYSKIFSDWNNLTEEILKTKVELEAKLTPGETEAKTPKDLDNKVAAAQNDVDYKRLKAKLDNLRNDRERIVSGQMNDYYFGQARFAATPALVNAFVDDLGIHNYTKVRYQKDYDQLTADEKAVIDEKYSEYTKQEEKNKVYTAFELFNSLDESISKDLLEIANKTTNLKNVYVPGQTVQTSRIQRIDELINNKQKEIDDAISTLPEGAEITENQDVVKLQGELKILEDYKDFVSKSQLFALASEISENSPLQRPSSQEELTELVLNNYANSYINYLQYLKNNNLYTDLTDTDLIAVLQSWIAVNGIHITPNKKWVDKFIEYSENKKWGYSPNDSNVVDLARRLTEFTDAISKGNLLDIKTLYKNLVQGDELNNIIDYINELEMSNGETTKEILDNLLPTIGNMSFIDFINQVSDLKSEIKTSPAYELLQKFAISTNGNSRNLIEILTREYNEFLNSKTLEDYIINDKDSLLRLKETSRLIDVLESLISASIDGGYNSQVNVFRNKLAKNLLAEIDTETAINMLNDLQAVQIRVNTLVTVAENNQAQKLREQKDIAINMRQRFTSLFLDNEHSTIKDKFASIFAIDLDQMIADSEFPTGEVTEENYKEYEEASIKLETSIWKSVNDLGLSDEEIVSRINSLFASDKLLLLQPTKLLKDTTVISDYDQAVYLLTTLAYPAQNFYNELKQVISSDDFDKAPIFSQEYAIRVAYASNKKRNLFNIFANSLNTLAQSSEDIYIRNKISLQNFICTFGGAGTGKTRGIAYVIKKMMPEAAVAVVAPTQKQTERLADAVQHDGLAYTKNELIEKILGRQLSDNDYIYSDKEDVDNLKLKRLKMNPASMFATNEQKVIFIDEVGQFSKTELELISSWANKNNISIIALGDYKQNSAYIMYKNKRYDFGVEDTFFVKTPDLSAPLRPNNIAKYDNYNTLNSILDQVWTEFYKDPSMDLAKVSAYVDKLLSKNKTRLKYFEGKNIFGGEKIISQSDVITWADKLSKLSTDVVIITDDPSKYSTVKNVKVVGIDSVQGDEFEYVIIDKDWTVTPSGEVADNYKRLKDLYTLTQRSTRGTVFTGNGISDALNLSTESDLTSAGNIEVSDNQIKDFKDWRLDLLSNLPQENIDINVDSQESVPQEQMEETLETNSDQQSTQSTNTQQTPESLDSKESEQTINSNEGNQAPVMDINPVHSPNIDKVVTPNVTSKESKLPTKSITTTDSNISRAVDNLTFITSNELINYDSNSEKSLFNKLSLGTQIPSKSYKRLVKLLGDYFTYGHYKIDPKETQKQLQSILLSDSDLKTIIPLIQPLFNNNNIVFKIVVPNGWNKGLMIAEWGDIEIPLLITAPKPGIYNGEIFVGAIHYETDETPHIVNISNFKNSAINSDNLFTALPRVFALQVDNNEQTGTKWDQRTFEYIWGTSGQASSRKNGNSFILVSADSLASTKQFEANLKASIASDGTVTYLTQQNASMQLLGVNAAESFRNIIFQSAVRMKEYYDTPKANRKFVTYLSPYRAGSIISLAYNSEFKSLVTQQLNAYLNNKKAKAINIINKNTKDSAIITYTDGIVSVNGISYDSLSTAIDTIINNSNPEDYYIMLGYMNNDEYRFNAGADMVNTVFGEAGLFNENVIDKLQDILDNSSQFKLGIYVFDKTTKPVAGSQYFYEVDSQNKNYITNVARIVGNDFIIDYDKIQPTSQDLQTNPEQEKLQKINNSLKELGFNEYISDLTKINEVITRINNQILETVSTPDYSIVQYTNNIDNPLVMEKVIKDPIPMIINMFKAYYKTSITPSQIQISTTSNLNFAPFLVSLDSENHEFVLEQKDNIYSIRDFNLYSEFNELKDYLNQNKNLFENSPEIMSYLKAIMTNTEVTDKIAEEYFNIVYSNESLSELRNRVSKYLLTKLENNEC